MAEINANSLPAKTELGSNDSAIVVDQTSNAGALVDLDVLADKVLDRISSKPFANQVGGSSAATLLAQLSTLNSNSVPFEIANATSLNGTTADCTKGRVYIVTAGSKSSLKVKLSASSEKVAIVAYFGQSGGTFLSALPGGSANYSITQTVYGTGGTLDKTDTTNLVLTLGLNSYRAGYLYIWAQSAVTVSFET